MLKFGCPDTAAAAACCWNNAFWNASAYGPVPGNAVWYDPRRFPFASDAAAAACKN